MLIFSWNLDHQFLFELRLFIGVVVDAALDLVCYQRDGRDASFVLLSSPAHLLLNVSWGLGARLVSLGMLEFDSHTFDWVHCLRWSQSFSLRKIGVACASMLLEKLATQIADWEIEHHL